MEFQVQHANAATPGRLIVFVHGNGLVKSVFRQCIANLFALNAKHTSVPIHYLSLDLLGHGTNELAGQDLHEFTQGSEFAQPLVDKIQAYRAAQSLAFRECILVAHSVGAHISLFAHKLIKFDHAILLEPMIRERDEGGRIPEPPWAMMEQSKKRRSRFPSHQAAFDALRPRGMFKIWETECVRDYVFHGGFRATGNGSEVELSCNPLCESHIFSLDLTQIDAELPNLRFTGSVIVMAGKESYLPSEMFKRTADKLGASFVLVPGCDHVLMCEKPGVVAEQVYQVMQQQQQPPKL